MEHGMEGATVTINVSGQQSKGVVGPQSGAGFGAEKCMQPAPVGTQLCCCATADAQNVALPPLVAQYALCYPL